MFRWSTAGESHGRALIALLEGVPAGVRITSEQIAQQLQRRRTGYGSGARQAFEQDELTLLSGIRHGVTLGSPIAIEIGNSEWPKWEAVMAADPVDPALLLKDAGTGDEREIARNRPLTKPRPGHADLVGMNKYGFSDARPVLERASARETAARVAAGSVAAALNEQAAGIRVVSRVVGLGSVVDASEAPPLESFADVEAHPVRCSDPDAAQAMMDELDAAKKDGDTVGGVVEVLAFNVPQGLGSYVTPFSRLDARLAAAMMSIHAVKGVEIGDGFVTATRRGSHAHDEMVRSDSRIRRLTNRAGGIEGGMSNGEVLRVRVAFKPISTVPRALRTVDIATGEAATALHQRSDTTAVIRGAVVAEAMASLTLAESLLETFGGDSLSALHTSISTHSDSIPEAQR